MKKLWEIEKQDLNVIPSEDNNFTNQVHSGYDFIIWVREQGDLYFKALRLSSEGGKKKGLLWVGHLNCVLILQLSSVPPFYFWCGGAEKMNPYSLQNEAVHKFWSSHRQRGGNCLCLVSFFCVYCLPNLAYMQQCELVWVCCRINTSSKISFCLKLNLKCLSL